MCCTDTTNLGTVVELIIALFALIVSILSILYTSRSERQQRQLSFFSEYTRRYQEIMVHLYNSRMTDDHAQYRHLYFDLCSEEYYLHEKGYIPQKVWNLWTEGMRMVVNNKDFLIAWKICSQYYNDDFCHFIDKEIIKPSNK